MHQGVPGPCGRPFSKDEEIDARLVGKVGRVWQVRHRETGDLPDRRAACQPIENRSRDRWAPVSLAGCQSFPPREGSDNAQRPEQRGHEECQRSAANGRPREEAYVAVNEVPHVLQWVRDVANSTVLSVSAKTFQRDALFDGAIFFDQFCNSVFRVHSFFQHVSCSVLNISGASFPARPWD